MADNYRKLFDGVERIVMNATDRIAVGFSTSVNAQYIKWSVLLTELAKTFATLTQLGGKVDKVNDKSLIADSEITRLSGVTNQTREGLNAAEQSTEAAFDVSISDNATADVHLAAYAGYASQATYASYTNHADYADSADYAYAAEYDTEGNKIATYYSPTTHNHLDETIKPDIVEYQLTPTIPTTQGSQYWDVTHKVLSTILGNGVVLQNGLEMYVRIVNKTGIQIDDGQVVYINGAQGNRPTVALAQANSTISSNILGVATENIANNAEGFITIMGEVSFNTVGYTNGSDMYLSATIAGGLTATEPLYPNHKVIVAKALNSTNNGRICVHPQHIYELAELHGVDLTETALLNTNSVLIQETTTGKIKKTAISTLHSGIETEITNLTPISYNPTIMVVNTGTLNQGTVGGLSAVGGTDVIIQEANGADPLRVTFTNTGVTRLTSLAFYGRYAGGSGHIVNVECYNNTTVSWDVLGVIGTSATKQWYSFNIFQPNNYINAGTVLSRLNHLGTGNNSHQLILDYYEVNYGGAGGSTFVTASGISFAPTGNIEATNVQSAIAEVDSEKVDKSTYDANSILIATADNTPIALTVGASTFVGRKATGDISAMSAIEARAVLNVADGATANTKASAAEIATATDDTKFMTPKGLKDAGKVNIGDYITMTSNLTTKCLEINVNFPA